MIQETPPLAATPPDAPTPQVTLGGRTGMGDTGGIVQRNNLPPLPPKNWYIDTKGSGYVVRVQNRGRTYSDGPLSGASWYNVHWAETVDDSTADGIDAGFARSKVIAHVAATDADNMESESPLIDNADYKSGYLYVVGMSASGDRSDHGQPQKVGAAILSQAIPPVVNHFQVSESGFADSGTVWSELSCAMVLPNPLGGMAAVQLVLENYPNIGETTEWVTKRNIGGAGASMQFKELAQVCRRKGAGTVSVVPGATTVFGGGTEFTKLFVPGCAFEIAGIRVDVSAVPDDTHLTISAWPANAQTYVGFDQWEAIGVVRVYARGVSEAGIVETDLSKLPYVDVLLDGDLSAPVAPTITSATAMGNVVRIEVQQPIGTALDKVHLFRGASGAAFTACVEIDSMSINAAAAATSSGQLQFEDSNFTVYERENNVAFTYYCTVTNVRGESSLPSIAVTAQCRLDTGSDNGPPTTAREVPLNYLWNGMLSGTAGVVSTADTGQDANMGGGTPPTGWNRWDQFISGAGSTPSFINTTEVILAMTGAAGVAGVSGISQNVGAWSNGTAGKRRIPPGKILVFQFKARTTGGSPNGFLYFDIRQLNGAGVVQGSGGYRQRRSTDLVDFTDITAVVNCSNMTTDAQIYWGVFQLDTTLTTAEIQVRLYYLTSSWNGVNMYVSEVMLSIGETLPPWTGQMVDKNITYGAPSGGAPFTYSRFPDGYAANRNYVPVYP